MVSGRLAGWGTVPIMAAVGRPLMEIVVPCPIWRQARAWPPPIEFVTWGRKIGLQ